MFFLLKLSGSRSISRHLARIRFVFLCLSTIVDLLLISITALYACIIFRFVVVFGILLESNILQLLYQVFAHALLRIVELIITVFLVILRLWLLLAQLLLRLDRVLEVVIFRHALRRGCSMQLRRCNVGG